MSNQTRTFEDRPAVRERVPLLLGIVGPSSSGKTFSALRLATGIQRVCGGEIFGIDSEAKRMLHYAGIFKFRHVPFTAPFGPLDYLAAVQHCVSQGAKTIVVDSASHEHEGPGGVLEMHERELDRLAGQDYPKRNKLTMLAWAKPKQQRRQFINAFLQMDVNIIFCFRAKPKLKMVRGQDPIELGYMPIAGDEFIYEMVLKCLLLPGANGVPTWKSDYPGEMAMMKLPEQFKAEFGTPQQLSEDIGQKLAEWAAGAGATPPDHVSEWKTFLASNPTIAAFEAHSAARWPLVPETLKKPIKALIAEAGWKWSQTAKRYERPENVNPAPASNQSIAPDDDGIGEPKGLFNNEPVTAH